MDSPETTPHQETTPNPHEEYLRGYYQELAQNLKNGELTEERFIEEMVKERLRLESLADHDPLTGLLNRRGFSAAFEFVQSTGRDGVLALIDVDDFKKVNDAPGLGHPAGDKVLRIIADRLREETRSSDLLTRLGGDEFGIFLDGVSLTQGFEIIEQIRLSIIDQVKTQIPEMSWEQTTSNGIARVYSGNSFEFLYELVDKTLYQAKAEGKNLTVMADKP